MFGKKKQPPIRTLVGEGTLIHGELRFNDGLRIDGEVLGDVTALGDGSSILVISEKARVTASCLAVTRSSTAPSTGRSGRLSCWSCNPAL